jgi:hypothetical protein
MAAGATRHPTSNPTTPAGSPARRLRLASYKWRRAARPVPGGLRPVRVAAWALTYLLICGLLFWVSLWLWPPHPASLVLVGAGYETNLAVPQNVFGRAGLEGLKALAASGPVGRPGRLSLGWGPRTVRKRDPWDKGLGALPGKTALVVMALHGGSDPSGAYLLPDDAGADPGPGNRVRLDAVLDRLEQAPFRGKNVVLVLDATRLTADWSLGMVRNDFARELDRLNDRVAKVPNLVVLSASGPDQRSWVSDYWRQSVFVHFLIEGLRGSAAGDDGRVDAADLFGYARREVANWVRSHRGAEQEPVLLPRGEAGLARAAGMELCVAPREVVPTPEAPEPSAEVESPELKAAWDAFDRLRGQSPHPAGYSPQLWSLYLASLLRFDELQRSGDPGSGQVMLRKLTELEREIERARYLSLGSAQNTLAMPAAEGREVTGPTAGDIQRMNALRGAPTAEIAKRWEQLRSGAGAPGSVELRGLRTRIFDMIVQRVADDLAFNRVAGDPADFLGKSVAVVEVVEDPAAPRPAEVHDLVMIHRDLPRTPPPSYYRAVGLALQTRRLAERTAAALATEPPAPAGPVAATKPTRAASARVFPWVRAPLARADEERRLGVDLLFSSDPRDWDEAETHLDAAARAYRDVSDAAGVVRDALALRDEMLPVLPGYCRWLARWSRDGDGLMELAESIWDDVHALTRALEADPPDFGSIRSEPRPTADDPHPLSLAERVDRVRTRFDRLQRGFASACDRALRAESPDAWGVLDDALRVPFADLPPAVEADLPMLTGSDRPLRFKLIADARTIGRRELPRPGDQGHAPEALVRAEAGRQARLALAALGRGWFEASEGVDGLGFEEARVQAAATDGSALPALGRRIGESWRALPGELVRVLNGSRTSAKTGELSEVLRRADRLARQLDGAGADVLARHVQPVHLPGALAPALSPDRLTAHRRSQTRDFLLAQAERALEDHWAAERDGAPQPYYRAAGLAYLADASAMDPERAWPQGPLEELKARINRPDDLRLEGPTRFTWTSERQVDLTYRVLPEQADSTRQGFPVLWMSPARGLTTAAPPTDTRFAFRIGPGVSPRLPCRLEDPAQAGADPGGLPHSEATSTASGLFRGQRFDLTTRIDLHRTPKTVAAGQPRPPSGRVAVRAEDPVFERSGVSRGAVAVVLDASGSMGPPRGQSFSETTRYAVATRALEQVLRDMPAGTTVSLYLFGAATPNHEDIAAEQTIRTVRPPTRWDPSQLGPLMAEIRYPRVEPWNDSPIVRTMIRARDDLLRLTDSGLKTLVVITDGDDNRFESDPLRGGGGKDIAAFLRESFKDTGIQINMITVPLTDPALVQKLQTQFRVIEELPVAGRFYDADRPVDLVTSLRTVFRQELTYRVVGEDRRPIPGISARDVTVSRLDADDIWCPWPLPAGGYRVQVHGDRPQEADVALDGGDLLLLTLGDRGGAPTFTRGLFAQEFYPNQPAQTDRAFRWRLTALQNQLVGDRSLRLLATLERLSDESEGVLRLARPREVWFEVAPGEDVRGDVVLRWGNREGYPAAAWGLEVADWPRAPGTDEPARPTLRAWWREALPAPPDDTLAGVKPIDVRLPLDRDRNVELPSGTVVIRGVQVEDHAVEVAAGDFRRVPCLVVRLSYPKGKPVWVSPRGINAVGWEHRFYRSADSYTGLFWTQTRDEAFTTVDRLELVGLDTFKRACEGEGGFIELPLDAPRSGSTPPPPFDDRRAPPPPPPARPPASRGIMR